MANFLWLLSTCKPCDPQLCLSSAEQSMVYSGKSPQQCQYWTPTGEDDLSGSLGHVEPGHQEFRLTLAEETLVS